MLARADTAKPSKLKKIKNNCNDWKLSKVDVNYRPSKVLNFEPVLKEHRAGMIFTSLFGLQYH